MAEPIEVDADPPRGILGLLQIAFSETTKIPKAVLDLIPSRSIGVSSLLKKPLPPLLHPSAINLRPAESCLAHLAARWTVDELMRAPIPSKTWLYDLETSLNKKWHMAGAGAASIQHPTISHLYLPFWVGNFWYYLVEAAEQKEEWGKAERWISGQVQDAKTCEARELMQRIPWGMSIWALAGVDSSSPVGVLAELLSANWLRERHLDTLASYLNCRAGKDKDGAATSWVGDVYLSTCVKRMYRATKTGFGANQDLIKYRDIITAHDYKRLFANLDNNHWIVFSVDFVKNQFCYGDSLGGRSQNTDLQHMRRGLEKWLKVAFGFVFKDLGNALPIGRQTDGHSCGICVINAVEHAMFGVPLFTDRDRYRLRIRYFVEAVEYLLNGPPQSRHDETTGPGVGEVAGIVGGPAEGREEMAGETPEGGRVGSAAGTWDEEMEWRDSVVPQSPTPSVLVGDAGYPPSSDAGIETMSDDDSMASDDEVKYLTVSGAAGANRSRLLAERQGKRVRGSDDQSDGGCGPSRKRLKGRMEELDELDDESGRDRVLSRSAAASRKLKESLKCGEFVAGEGKRERFEKKCCGLDEHARFRYKESWQVRHSKCSKWVTMREPYESVRFGEHIKGCKQMGEKGRNRTIDSFFKRQDTKETGTRRMAQPSALQDSALFPSNRTVW